MSGSKITSDGHEPEKIQLKRELGLFSAINFILAIMIGSGIFVSSTSALKYSGSVGMCIVVWFSCGIISLLGALAYSELGTLVPRSGSEYAYFMDAFGPLHAFWGPLPAFLYSWIMIAVIRPAEIAILVLTFARYSCQPILDVLCITDEEMVAENLFKIVAVVALGMSTYINVSSVKLYVKVQNVFGVCKIVACLVVIFCGIYQLFLGKSSHLSRGFEGTSTSPKDLALAFYSGLWAYDGWSTVTVITEEIRKPEVNIPKSILIAVPLVTLLYVFMNISYMSVLSLEEMVNAEAVAVTFGERVMGKFSVVIPVGVAVSTFGCAMSLQFGVTRLCYVSGQDGFMLESLSYVHHKKLTPSPAVIMQGFLSFLFISLGGGVLELIEFASFLIWFFYGIAMIALIVMRKTMKHAHRPYKVPIAIPVFIFLVSLYLSIIPIVMRPSLKYLMVLLFVAVGVLVYYYCIYKNKKPKRVMDRITNCVQLLFMVVPPEGN